MSERRPVLLGLDDPISAAPNFPLFPTPGSPGHKLLLTVQGVDPEFTETDYLRYFERITLCPTYPATKDPVERRNLWTQMTSLYRGRIVVCMGKPVWALSGMDEGSPYGVLYPYPPLMLLAWLPHPSAKNRFYNSETNRNAVGNFLRSLVRRG